MSQAATLDEDILSLRSAAERRDFNGCRDATEKLLLRLPLHRALKLTREQVARRLPAFERHQPGVAWPRQFIESVEYMKREDGWNWPSKEDEFPGPGANSFIKAVDKLWHASLLLTDEAARIEALVDAIASVVLVDMCESWGARHPAEWARWYQLAISGEFSTEKLDISEKMLSDPEVIQIKCRAWTAVAVSCAEALGVAEDLLPPQA